MAACVANAVSVFTWARCPQLALSQDLMCEVCRRAGRPSVIMCYCSQMQPLKRACIVRSVLTNSSTAFLSAFCCTSPTRMFVSSLVPKLPNEHNKCNKNHVGFLGCTRGHTVTGDSFWWMVS
jgi:hypothetical protein